MLGLSLAIRVGKRVLGGLIDSLMSAIKGRATYSENIADSKQVVKDIDNYELLDKASILLTPTAYSDARVHSVKTYTGDELVTNGTFDTDSNWTKSTGWSISNGNASYDGSGTGYQYVSQAITTTSAGLYKINFDVLSSTGSNLNIVDFGAVRVNQTHLSVGNYTYYAEADSASENLTIYANGTDTFSIDNVSVVDVSSDFDFDRASSATRINSDGLVQDMQSITDPELVLNGDFEELGDEEVNNGGFDTDSGWGVGAKWTIANGVARLVSSDGSSSGFSQSSVFEIGKTYKMTFDAVVVSGSAKIESAGGGTLILINETKTYNHTFVADRTDLYFNRVTSVSDITIDNISVQQVDPNDRWTAQNGWTLQDGLASFGGTVSSYRKLFQENFLTIGNTYELSFEILSISSGSIANLETGSPSFDTVGVKTQTFVATFDDLYLEPTTDANLTIDNVSIKDITFSEDVDLARINYDSNGENGHWLLEPTSTNEITYSEDLSQWTSNDVTVTDNNAISPDGTQNASKIELDSGTSIKRISLSSMPTSSVNRSFSVFIKANSDFTGAVQLVHSGDLQGFANFDLSDGTVGSTGSKTTANIVSYANDWYRCTAIFDSTNTFASTVYLWVQDNDSGSYGGSTSATGSIFAYGFQYEALSYATSYIPTYGSTVTRATETLTGSGNSTLINSTEGVLYAEIAASANSGDFRIISLSDGTNDNRVRINYTTVSEQIQARVVVGGVTQAEINEYGFSNITDFTKIALAYKENEVKLYINGSLIGTDTSASMASVNTFDRLNFNGSSTNPFYGKCKAVAVFDEALEDDELELLTGITNYGSFNELAQANGYTII